MMDRSPLVSVLLPVHNGAPFVEEAVASIMAQQYRRLQIVIVDDGSTDGTSAILDRLARTDSRLHVMHRARSGLVASLNAGLAEATGEFVARMDHDDIAYPARISLQLAYLQQRGLDVCGSWVELFGERRALVRTPVGSEALGLRMIFSCPIVHPTAFFRMSSLRQYGYAASSFCEDYDLFVRMAAAGLRLGNVPQPLLRYRIHPAQVTRIRAPLLKRHAEELGRRHFRSLFPDSTPPELALIDALITRDRTLREPGCLAAAGEVLLRRLAPAALEARATLLADWRNLCRPVIRGIEGWRSYYASARLLRDRPEWEDVIIAWKCLHHRGYSG